jgi:hypothetical protein
MSLFNLRFKKSTTTPSAPSDLAFGEPAVYHSPSAGDFNLYIGKSDSTAFNVISNTVSTITSSTTATSWQSTFLINASSGDVVFTLPLSSQTNAGKAIEIKRIDNTTNTVKIIPNGTQTLDSETSSGGIYLYNQHDAIVIRSDGINSYIVSYNRNNVGQGRSYLMARVSDLYDTNNQTGDHIKFDTVHSINGNAITIDTTSPYTNDLGASIGRITLQPNKTYKLQCNLSGVWFFSDNPEARLTAAFYNLTNEAFFSSTFGLLSNIADGSIGQDGSVVTTISPSVETQIEVRIIVSAGLYQMGWDGLLPHLWIEEI